MSHPRQSAPIDRWTMSLILWVVLLCSLCLALTLIGLLSLFFGISGFVVGAVLIIGSFLLLGIAVTHVRRRNKRLLSS